MPNRYVCLQTEHVQKFQCDGTECQSRCCKGWGVQIDGESWQKYNAMRHEPDRKKILSAIGEMDGKLQIKPLSDGKCPFLREDSLCGLQHDYGEDYLSSICRTYPRSVAIIEGMMERSLDLSCPLAARIVLRKRAPMEFEQVEVRVEQPMTGRKLAPVNGMERLPELQYTAISLLQNRRLPMDGRLALAGIFFEQLQNNSGQDIDNLIHFYASDRVGEQKAEMLRSIHFNSGYYLGTMFALLGALRASQNELRRWNARMEHVMNVFGTEDFFSASIEGLAENYGNFFTFAKARLVKTYGYLLENYLVNDFLGSLYPFRVPGSVAHNYGIFLLNYKFLEFLLVAMMADTGRMDSCEDALVEEVSNFAIWVDHTPKYLECVAEEAKKRSGGPASFWLDLLQV